MWRMPQNQKRRCISLKPFDVTLPIPHETLPDTGAVKICPVEDPLVCISETMQDVLLFEPRYYMAGIHGATTQVWVRGTVSRMLLEAAKLLPAGYKLKIYDAWRPAAVQRSLFCNYYNLLKAAPRNAGLSEAELMDLARCFVSFPSEDPNQPFVHSTGGAVDLTVVDADGRELDMGTDFDDFTGTAHTAYFETFSNTVVRDNRRLLYHVMTAVGFTSYPYEWWHYDFGDRFWAAIKQKNSIYPGIYTEPEHP